MNELNDRARERDPHNVIEDPIFWQSHIDRHQKTTQSRKAYCREQQLNYNRFQYWLHKLKVKPAARFPRAIPIQVKPAVEPKRQPLLCTLDCGEGRRLFIHDLSVVMHLLKVGS